MNPFTYNPEREPMPPIVAQRKHDVSEARYEVERIAPIYESDPVVTMMPILPTAEFMSRVEHVIHQAGAQVVDFSEMAARKAVEEARQLDGPEVSYDLEQAA